MYYTIHEGRRTIYLVTLIQQYHLSSAGGVFAGITKIFTRQVTE